MQSRRYVAATSHAPGAVWTTNAVFVGDSRSSSQHVPTRPWTTDLKPCGNGVSVALLPQLRAPSIPRHAGGIGLLPKLTARGEK